MIKSALALLAAALILSPMATSAQTQKIGYVNSAKIFQELPDAQSAQKRIDGLTRPIQDTLEAMQRNLQSSYEEYQKKESLYNEATKKSEQQKLIEAERRMQEFRLEKLGQDGELAKQTEKLLTPIRDKIKAAIATVAKEEKYSFVFDRTETVQILLYGDPAHDITFKVIDRLKRGK